MSASSMNNQIVFDQFLFHHIPYFYIKIIQTMSNFDLFQNLNPNQSSFKKMRLKSKEKFNPSLFYKPRYKKYQKKRVNLAL